MSDFNERYDVAAMQNCSRDDSDDEVTAACVDWEEIPHAGALDAPRAVNYVTSSQVCI